MILALLLAASANPSLTPLTRDFDALSKGTAGVEFALPGGGGPTVGITYFIADSLAARVDFSLDAVLSPSGTPATFGIGLAVRSYLPRHGPVGLFFSPAIGFGREVFGVGLATEAAEYISLGGAFGAEYFFTDHFSAGGQLGLALRFGNIGGPTGSSVQTRLSTATSGLFASIYF